MIDGIDLHILNIIQNDGKISNAKLARQLQMAPSGVLERVRKLEKKGILEGYEVRLNPAKLGLTVTAFIRTWFHVLLSVDQLRCADVIRFSSETLAWIQIGWVPRCATGLVWSCMIGTAWSIS